MLSLLKLKHLRMSKRDTPEARRNPFAGITSSRPTTHTTGIRRRTWCWWTACGAASLGNSFCMQIAMECFVFSTGPAAKLLSATPFERATWVRNWDEDGRSILASNAGASAAGNVVYPALRGGPIFKPRLIARWLTAATGQSETRKALRIRIAHPKMRHNRLFRS